MTSDIKRNLERGEFHYSALIQLVKSNPTDQFVAASFFTEYEKVKEHDANDSLIYLKLKYLHQHGKASCLNDVARIYINSQKNRLALMCLTESLRLNPTQPEILHLVEALAEHVRPKFPQEFGEDRCAVSVIMPTYNRPEEIKQSIESVLNQTFPDFELIIVNDGGTDEVSKTIASFNSPKIKYHKVNENKGLAAALNEGISRATGTHIAYLDDDDIYYPNHLETLITCIQNNPNYDLVYSNAWWCYGQTRNGRFVEHCRKLLERRPKTFDKDLLFKQNYISTLNLLHKKSCLRKTGLFDEALTKLMDWELWMRSTRYCTFHQVNKITGEYRWKENNMCLVDSLGVTFLFRIISSYYGTHLGKLPLLKAYVVQNRKHEAEELFEEIVTKYDEIGVKTPLFIRELSLITGCLEGRKCNTLVKKITRSHFKIDAASCLNNIIWNKSINRLLYILHVVPIWLFKTVVKKLCNEFVS
jgi:glycosyltransferase involved in cell wall biosynthesis